MQLAGNADVDYPEMFHEPLPGAEHRTSRQGPLEKDTCLPHEESQALELRQLLRAWTGSPG